MVDFNASKKWVVFFPPEISEAKKAAGDLVRYIGLLASTPGTRGTGGDGNRPSLVESSAPVQPGAVIALNSEGKSPEHNGFSWRAGSERVEIYGESGRGLCNGIYSFLAALGICWPAPGEEKLPEAGNAKLYPLSVDSANEPSRYKGNEPALWRRFVPANKETLKKILRKGEAFAAWAARRRYDAVVLPLAVFASANPERKLKELKKQCAEYGVALEAGGRDLSALVPRKYFLLHRDFFRMEGGKRNATHHFCPTSPGAIAVIGREGQKLLRAGTGVFHLWPDRGAETAWCSCPTCRAFTPAEQNRIAVNTAADVLAKINPGALITFYEKPDEGGSIPLRRNLLKLEKLPEEKDFRSQ